MIRSLLRKLFPNTIYVMVREYEFTVKHIESGRKCRKQAESPFTTNRLLVGDFVEAESLLKACFKEVLSPFVRFTRPRTIIHPLEMVEGGLSWVEHRVFRELAFGAGGEPSLVWVGHQLSDVAVKEKLRDT